MRAYLILLLVLCSGALGAAQTTLRVDVNMVEVYVGVSDRRGRPVTDLTLEDFQVFEDGRQQTVRVFEPQTTATTVALLVDTTGSMQTDLPHVKNAVARLLMSLKAEDSVGLFTFANRLRLLDGFTRDRSRTLNSLLATRAAGATALFDALAQLSREASRIAGKKAILLFTDGDDNLSTISLEASVREVQRIGVPVYSMVYGRARENRSLTERLEEISESTGALPFEVRRVEELVEVFGEISDDLQYLYLLGYQSDNPNGEDWREVSVTLPARPDMRVRAREGYWK